MLHPIRAFLKRIPLDQELVAGGFLLTLALVAAVAGYGYLRLSTLSGEVARLNTELASTTAFLQNNLAEATTSLGDALQEERQKVAAKLDDVQDRVGSLGGTLTDLQKLSKTDRELLAKYSKVFFLNENYEPLRLVEIPSEYNYIEKNRFQIIPEVLPYLEELLDEAKDDKIELYIQSAYRSFYKQEALKGQYSVTYGVGTANQFSADQGYSEHQLGTTVDFITTGTGGQLAGFDRTPAYAWLLANAHTYGFVLSYPQNNGYFIFEPWHWRFVGVKLATDLYKKKSYFYTMDQRTIDTYLISLFD